MLKYSFRLIPVDKMRCANKFRIQLTDQTVSIRLTVYRARILLSRRSVGCFFSHFIWIKECVVAKGYQRNNNCVCWDLFVFLFISLSRLLHKKNYDEWQEKKVSIHRILMIARCRELVKEGPFHIGNANISSLIYTDGAKILRTNSTVCGFSSFFVCFANQV